MGISWIANAHWWRSRDFWMRMHVTSQPPEHNEYIQCHLRSWRRAPVPDRSFSISITPVIILHYCLWTRDITSSHCVSLMHSIITPKRKRENCFNKLTPSKIWNIFVSLIFSMPHSVSSSLLHMVSRDRDRIESKVFKVSFFSNQKATSSPRHFVSSVRHNVPDNLHWGLGRINERVADHEFFQDVVLYCPCCVSQYGWKKTNKKREPASFSLDTPVSCAAAIYIAKIGMTAPFIVIDTETCIAFNNIGHLF